MTELEKAVRMAMEAFDEFSDADDFATCFRLTQKMNAMRELLTQALATTEHDCSRSHPHENMSPMCELRTEIARLRNENTRLKHSTTERKLVATPDHNGAPVPASPVDMQVYDKIAAGYWTSRKGEPFGQVTVKHPVGPFHAPLYTFYPWPQPPHLDNVQECHTVYTSPQVPEDVIAILDECRTALIECDRDCDYELIDRAYAALDAARK